MPYADHLRLTMSGEIRNSATGSVVERFAMRLNLSDPGLVGTDTFSLTRAQDAANDCKAFFGRVTTNIRANAVLTEVKLAQINSLGKYRSDPHIIGALGTPGANTDVGFRVPPQVALAVSLDTARRGPTGKGRMYLPLPAAVPGPNAELTDQAITDIAGSVRLLVSDLNNWPGFDGPSPKVVIASSKGYNSEVTSVRVGRILDTIRSRRTGLQERYSGAVAI